MVMVEGNKVRELAEFAVGGIVRNVVPQTQLHSVACECQIWSSARRLAASLSQ